MANESKDTERLRKIVSLLPKENCGKCGFENCGKFALALVAGKASPIDCRKSLDRVNEICQVLGVEVPEGAELQAVGLRGHHHGGHHGHHGHHGGNGKGGDGHRHSGRPHAKRHSH